MFRSSGDTSERANLNGSSKSLMEYLGCGRRNGGIDTDERSGGPVSIGRPGSGKLGSENDHGPSQTAVGTS